MLSKKEKKRKYKSTVQPSASTAPPSPQARQRARLAKRRLGGRTWKKAPKDGVEKGVTSLLKVDGLVFKQGGREAAMAGGGGEGDGRVGSLAISHLVGWMSRRRSRCK